MSAYYNDHDPYAAAWLRALIAKGLIADGEVDDRSIADVHPDDMRGFTQAHFFAGIGGWSLALRLAGWPDDRPVWTGSCPCQPYSCAGAQRGKHDPRDLWPIWFPLIQKCRPDVVFAEQVDASIRHGWLDRVYADLEGQRYAVGAIRAPAASVGAYHIRQRLWIVAHPDVTERESRIAGCARAPGRRPHGQPAGPSAHGHVGDAARGGQRIDRRAPRHPGHDDQPGPTRDVADARADGPQRRLSGRPHPTRETQHRSPRRDRTTVWSDAEWIPCADGKTRPIEPGTFPLAHGISGRVGRLRGYGNAIVPQAAAALIRAYLEIRA